MKRIVLGVSMLALVAGSTFGGTITWSYGGDLGGAYSDGWVVELIEDVAQDGINITTMWDDHTITGDDAFISTPVTTALVDGKAGVVWSTPFSAPGASLASSDHIYTVIYNATSFGAATMYQVVDSSAYVLPATNIDADYTLSAAPAGAWSPIVPVPEPGSIALFALGLVTLAARRKRH
ncbi:MAG: PEP-CTERM sorting domain-containing protein [Verrucomicrobia bacterium]|nr:PEP-CTERM sorting domain-containing protein [Verrucomicrobiota bacterium]